MQHIVYSKRRDTDDARPARRIILGLEATPDENVDLEIWVEDEEDERKGFIEKHWYLIAEVIDLEGGKLREVTMNFTSGGRLYFRIINGKLDFPRNLLVRITY